MSISLKIDYLNFGWTMKEIFPNFQTENFAKIELTKKKLSNKNSSFFSSFNLIIHCCFGHRSLDLSMHKTSIQKKTKKTSLTCVSELTQAEVIKEWTKRERKRRIENKNLGRRINKQALLPSVLHAQTHE